MRKIQTAGTNSDRLIELYQYNIEAMIKQKEEECKNSKDDDEITYIRGEIHGLWLAYVSIK